MHALRSFHAVATTVAIAAVVTACGDPAHPPAAPFVGASDAPGADAFSDTATDAPVEAPPSTTMSFDKWLTPTIWTKLKRAIAVDTTGRIFVTDGATVFAVSDQGVPSIYLTATELLAAIGSTISSPDIESLDVDADGKLYLLDRSLKEQIFLSPAAHSVAKFNDLAGLTFPKLISVVSPDRILVVHSDGLSEVTAAGVKSIYPRETLGGSTDCFSEAFGARRDGFVYYAPGCTGNDLNGGKSDGTGIGVLARNDDVYNGIGKAHFIDFSGIARGPGCV